MNQKRKHPTNAMFESESREVSQRLDKIEQRLKATRPQAVRLDVAAIEQLAKGRAVDAVVELPADRRSHRTLGIVGAWLCGAGVGALAMFVLMSRLAPTSDSDNGVAHVELEAPTPISHASETDLEQQDESPAVEIPQQHDNNVSKLTLVLEPLGHTDSTYLADGPTLGVGMYLKRHAMHSTWWFERAGEKVQPFMNDGPSGLSESSTNADFFREPRPPVSRRELMEEFLGESSEAVL